MSVRTIAVWVPHVGNALVEVQVSATGWIGGRANADGYIAFNDVDEALGDSTLRVTADGFAPYEQHVVWHHIPVDARPGDGHPPLNHQLTVGQDLPALTPAGRAMRRVHVEGLKFIDDAGVEYVWAMQSGFRDLERLSAGQDIRPLCAETRDLGGNGRRVFGAFDFGSPAVQRYYPFEHPDTVERIRELFSIYAEFGLRGEFVACCDTRRAFPGGASQIVDYWQALNEVFASIPNAFLEKVNENDSHDNRVDVELARPIGICASNGSNGAGNNPPGPYWDYAGLHSERKGDMVLSTTSVHFAIYGYDGEDGEPGFDGTGIATPVNEPPGIDDMFQPGHRINDPMAAYLNGVGCRFGSGGTAHPENGVHSILLSPLQRTCVAAFFRGLRG